MKKKILSSLISGKLLAVFCLLSCSDNNDPITEEPDPEEPGIEVVEPGVVPGKSHIHQAWAATAMLGGNRQL